MMNVHYFLASFDNDALLVVILSFLQFLINGIKKGHIAGTLFYKNFE